MAYDATSDRMILFGGLNPGILGDTWAYDFNRNSWTNMNPTTAPSARSSHAMAYDEQSDRVILFGGVDGAESNETWAYDFETNTWTNLAPESRPSARHGHRMAYDARSDRIVLVGGHRGTATFFGDTWAYDFEANRWYDQAPATHPEGGNHGGLVYHDASNRVILFGGFEASASKRETWSYDFYANSWTELQPRSPPSARFLPGMAYDGQSDRIILFGGTAGPRETWTLDVDANEWTKLDVPSAPSARNGHRMSYDRQSDRIILFGGGDGLPGVVNSETWAFDLGASDGPEPFPWLPVTLGSVATTAVLVTLLFVSRRRRPVAGAKDEASED